MDNATSLLPINYKLVSILWGTVSVRLWIYALEISGFGGSSKGYIHQLARYTTWSSILADPTGHLLEPLFGAQTKE
jgi:hypothetical protein